jgi:hypothetical protein
MSRYEDAAKEGFEKARLIYDGKIGGQKPKEEEQSKYPKSLNKLRLDKTHEKLEFLASTKDPQELVPFIDSKHKARFINARDKDRPPDEQDESILEMGQRLLELLATNVYALNCSELASIAIAVAHKKLSEEDVPHLGKASLRPGDHAFCVVALPEHLCMMHDTTVKNLKTTFKDIEDVWVADPWLNVRCKIRDYPEMAKKKLGEWQRANKRILWTGGSLGSGWYQPLGEYAKKFEDTTIKFDRIT